MKRWLAAAAALTFGVTPVAAQAANAEASFHGIGVGAVLLVAAIWLQASVLRRVLYDWAPTGMAAVVGLSIVLNAVSGSVLAVSAPLLNLGPEHVFGESIPHEKINGLLYEIDVLKAIEKRRPDVHKTIETLERRIADLRASGLPIRRWERMAQPGRWTPATLWLQVWASSILLGVLKQWPLIVLFSARVIRRANTLVCLRASLFSVLAVHALYWLVYMVAPGTSYHSGAWDP